MPGNLKTDDPAVVKQLRGVMLMLDEYTDASLVLDTIVYTLAMGLTQRGIRPDVEGFIAGKAPAFDLCQLLPPTDPAEGAELLHSSS